MLLSVSNLRVAYGDIEAVHGISFEVAQGELVSIIGANGAGKTTTLRALMGLQPLRSGKIIFEGGDITSLPAHKRSALGIKIVPERARCFPQLSVYENLKMGVYGMQSKLAGKLAMIYELFPILKERSTQLANTLSGGEQQQLAIARARPEAAACGRGLHGADAQADGTGIRGAALAEQRQKYNDTARGTERPRLPAHLRQGICAGDGTDKHIGFKRRTPRRQAGERGVSRRIKKQEVVIS